MWRFVVGVLRCKACATILFKYSALFFVCLGWALASRNWVLFGFPFLFHVFSTNSIPSLPIHERHPSLERTAIQKALGVCRTRSRYCTVLGWPLSR